MFNSMLDEIQEVVDDILTEEDIEAANSDGNNECIFMNKQVEIPREHVDIYLFSRLMPDNHDMFFIENVYKKENPIPTPTIILLSEDSL